MITLRLATRNLWRAPRRSVLSMTAVVAGVGFFILGEGFVSGVSENLVVAAIDGSVGHVMIRPKDYPTQVGLHPVDELVELGPETRRLIEERSVAWTERILFAPTAATGRDNMRVVAFGYDPKTDPQVFPRDQWQVKGVMPDPQKRQIAMSHRVARLLQLEPGGRVVLQSRTHEGAINALEVEVSGLVRTINPAIDTLGIFVPRPLARELVGSSLPSHVSIKLRGRDEAEPFAEALRQSLGPKLEVVTWKSETAELMAIQDVRRRALDIVMFVLMMLAAFGIANTILMAAHERIREIGTLRAMGLGEAGVIGLFLVEGTIIGAIGSLLGAAWGGALVLYWSRSPIDFSETYEKMGGGISASSLIYTSFNPLVLTAAAAVGVLVAVLASIYPARVASRMVPGEAVRADQ